MGRKHFDISGNVCYLQENKLVLIEGLEMTVVIVAGSEEFFNPRLVEAVDIAKRLGAEFVVPRAQWISSRCGLYTHNFLFDHDARPRLEVFCRALIENFRPDVTPTLVLPDLLANRSLSHVAQQPVDVVRELVNALPQLSFEITAFAADDDRAVNFPQVGRSIVIDHLHRLADAFGRSGALVSVRTPVIIDDERHENWVLVANVLFPAIMAAIVSEVRGRGLVPCPDMFNKRVYGRLDALASAGILLPLSASTDVLHEIAVQIVDDSINGIRDSKTSARQSSGSSNPASVASVA